MPRITCVNLGLTTRLFGQVGGAPRTFCPRSLHSPSPPAPTLPHLSRSRSPPGFLSLSSSSSSASLPHFHPLSTSRPSLPLIQSADNLARWFEVQAALWRAGRLWRGYSKLWRGACIFTPIRLLSATFNLCMQRRVYSSTDCMSGVFIPSTWIPQSLLCGSQISRDLVADVCVAALFDSGASNKVARSTYLLVC